MDDDVTKVEVNSTDEWMSVTNPKPEEPIRGRLLFDRIIKKKKKKKKIKKKKKKVFIVIRPIRQLCTGAHSHHC